MSLFFIFIFLAGCSSEPNMELVSSDVQIREDRSGEIKITEGDQKGELIKPVTLSYDFVIKNNGSKTEGSMNQVNQETYEVEDGIKVTIVPNEMLIEAAKQALDYNIFDENERMKSRLGMGSGGTPVLKPNEEGTFSFDYDLGAKKENPEIRLVPSKKQLDQLISQARNATLIVSIKDEEIARFDLSKSE